MTLLDRLRIFATQHAQTIEDETHAREKRNALIRQARDAGHSLQEIAEAAGTTRQRIWQLVNGDCT